MGIMTLPLLKTCKIKKLPVPVKEKDEQAGGAAADKAADDADRQGRPSKCRAVDDELGIEQDRRHHKGRQPVLPHALPAEGGRDGDGPVHA